MVGSLKTERRGTRNEAKSNSNHSSGTVFGAVRSRHGAAFRSKQFVFVVGDNQAAFPVHAAVIAKQSKALDSLINGPMKEASEGKAILEDIEEDTFIRFCQFAYSGDYTTPDFTHIPTIELPNIPTPPGIATDRDDSRSTEPELEPEPAVDDGWGSTPKKPEKPKNPSKSSLLRQSLHDQLYDVETNCTILAARCKIRENSDPTEDYTTVFIGHAQLYVFAEKWGIASLKTLALSKLHKTLTTFTLYAVRRPDIAALLRYTFSNNHTPDLVDAVDDLRSLVMLYTVSEAENLIHCPNFLLLIGEGGQLAQYLVQMLMERID
ncbi:hypothetical protein BJ878DRAFT_578709 [Calycina marina]|uniref:BTB domain-containing protein n=1 Tax=Calycina marina TaxID=1763456 RepID=A0A9P7YW67_9HELO|nr:hypothetical protein BJ878DRAFT_578709 [Calycina marina]